MGSSPIISAHGRHRGHRVIPVGRPLPVVIDIVHPLHRDGVAGRGGAVAHHRAVSPPVPVGLDHRTHLAVEEAVGKSDKETLERDENNSGKNIH